MKRVVLSLQMNLSPPTSLDSMDPTSAVYRMLRATQWASTSEPNMFRSLFGTTFAGDIDRNSTDGTNEAAPPSAAQHEQRQQQQLKQKQHHRQVPISHSARHQDNEQQAADMRGGFFKLDPAGAAPEESLFDDLEVKPSTVPARPDSTSEQSVANANATAMPGADGGGVMSAFQFMATPADAGAHEETAHLPSSSQDTEVPTPSSGLGNMGAMQGGSDGKESREEGMSAFSFLTDPAAPASGVEVSPVEAVPGGEDGKGNVPGDSYCAESSSFSFLSRGAPGAGGEGAGGGGGGHGSAANSSVSSPAHASATSGIPSIGGGAGAGHNGDTANAVVAPIDETSNRPQLGSDASSGAGAAGSGAGASMTANPPRKPAAGVVRKKRTVKRVGYARDEAASTGTTPTVDMPPPAGGGISSMGAGVVGGEGVGARLSSRLSSSSMSSPTSSARGGVGAGTSQDEGGYQEPSPVYSRKPLGREGARGAGGESKMDDNMVAEAAAMAALAASMAPSEIQGGRYKGDLKQGSAHGAGPSSPAVMRGAAAVGASSGSRPTSLHKSGSFISKFKGLLSHSSSKSEGSPTAAEATRAFHEPSTEGMPTPPPSGDDETAGSYVQPSLSAAGDRARAEEATKVEGEGSQIQAVRAELSLLTQAFAEKSSLLSDCLSQAAASKATLEAKRISVGNAHTEGIRRLAEAEAEQQRLADAEEYEKAAELSVEIESVKADSEAAARSLRELQEEDASLERAAAEGRKNLLAAVQETADSLGKFQRRQDGKVGRLVAERAAVFEAERLRMNTEADRIALEKTHVERDSTHLEEELAQTEGAISLQTGGEDERMSKLGLMRMELEGEISEIEAQLEAKRGALREVMIGLGEAEARIDTVRGKFERQLLRLRERERLVAVSRQDCHKEEEALEQDRARHREKKEKATHEQAVLVEVVEGVGEELRLAKILQATLTKHWDAAPASFGDSAGVAGREGVGDEKDDDVSVDALATLRSEVDGARSKFEQGARAVAALEGVREDLQAESDRNAEALPGLEQSKKAAVTAKNYKEAGQMSRQMKDTERRQQEVSELLMELDESLAGGSDTRQELEAMTAELTHAEEALKVAEQSVAVARISALEKKAKPLRQACKALRGKGTAIGFRDTAQTLLMLQLAALEAEAKDIGARHSLPHPHLSQPQPGDSDDEVCDVLAMASHEGVVEADPEAKGRAGDGLSQDEGSEQDLAGKEAIGDGGERGETPPPEPAFEVEREAAQAADSMAGTAARYLPEAEVAEAERELAKLDALLAEALSVEDYDEAAELDTRMTEVRARLADFTAQAAAQARGVNSIDPANGDERVDAVDADNDGDCDHDGANGDKGDDDEDDDKSKAPEKVGNDKAKEDGDAACERVAGATSAGIEDDELAEDAEGHTEANDGDDNDIGEAHEQQGEEETEETKKEENSMDVVMPEIATNSDTGDLDASAHALQGGDSASASLDRLEVVAVEGGVHDGASDGADGVVHTDEGVDNGIAIDMLGRRGDSEDSQDGDDCSGDSGAGILDNFGGRDESELGGSGSAVRRDDDGGRADDVSGVATAKEGDGDDDGALLEMEALLASIAEDKDSQTAVGSNSGEVGTVEEEGVGGDDVRRG